MSRFSNEEQIKLFYKNNKRAPLVAYFLMNLFGLFAAIIITFFGISFDSFFGIRNFVLLVLVVVFAALCAVLFVTGCNKYELINGNKKSMILVIPFIVLLAVFVTYQSFVTKIVDSNIYGGFEVKTNLIGFLFVFLPLMLASYTLYYCLFGRFAEKYARLKRKKKL